MNRVADRSSRSAVHAIGLSLAFVLVGVVAGTGHAQSQAQGRGRSLFAPGAPAGAASPQDDTDRLKKRGRRVRADLTALTASDAAGTDDVITVNLFDDVQLRARRQGALKHTRPGGVVWHGRLLDIPGEATFAINGDVMAGAVFAGDRVFEIVYAGDGEHEVRELDPSAFPSDDPYIELPSAEPDAQGEADPGDALVAGDSASQIDVMILWTPAAASAAGGTAAMQSLADLSVATTNTSYANSGVTQRLRVVYSGQISYAESTAHTDLTRMFATSDGYLDSVHTLRNTYGADVVTLLGHGYTSGGVCGVGYLMQNVSTGFASYAFNVVDRTCAAGNLSYAHELGHNMGLHHDPANAPQVGAYSYAYGYQDPAGAFRTVMAYSCPSGSCPRLTRFSNPSLTYNGKVTGTANHNNALALNNTAPSVANFRQAVGVTCSYSLGSSSTSVGSGAATGTVSVTAGSGCAWTAASNASWLTITSGASGSGSGAAGFSVQANTAGASRSGTLTVAGRSFTVTQAAAACGAFSLSPSSQSVGAAGGSVSVSVSGTSGCARTATSNAAWIAVTSGASGTGSGTVGLSIAANTAGTSRTGTATIGGQTFTVTQSAAACGAFSLSPSSQSVGAAGGSVSVSVSGTSGCARTATSNAAWIAVTSGASGTGSGTVGLSVAANTAGTSRTGTVTIGGQSFTVAEAAAVCSYTISPGSASVPGTGGTGSFTLTTLSGCSAAVTASASWITITSGASGTSRLIGYSVAPNTGGARTGTIAVGGQTFTISQAKKTSSNRKAINSAKADFNGDSMADLLWQHAGGSVALWTMDHLSANELVFLNSVGPAWKMVGSGDLDGDGKPEILWHHQTGGWLVAWFTDGRTVQQAVYLNPNRLDTAWTIAALADFNGDGKADLVLQHADGRLGVWYMNGTALAGSSYLNPSSIGASSWRIVGAGDLDGDTQTDLVWLSDSGVVGAWLMSGTTARSTVLLTPAQVSAGWNIRGLVDLNDDDQLDVIWQHDAGMVGAWLMNGLTATSFETLRPGAVGAGWRMVGPR